MVKIILVALLFLGLYVAFVFYIGWSGWNWLKPKFANKWFKYLYITTLFILSSSFIMGQFFPIKALDLLGNYWLAVFYLLVLLLPPIHLTVWLLQLFRLPRQHVSKWAGIFTLIALLFLILYGTYNAYVPVIRSYDVQIAKEAPDPNTTELNIIVVSDTHFGLLSNRKHAERMVQEINALNPDLVLIPGDIVDDEIQTFLEQEIDQVLAQIDAKMGVFASLGNHDHHDGTMQQLIAAIERSNIKVLYDETIILENNIIIVGRKDRIERDRASLALLMDGLDRSYPIILLDHQPYDLNIAKQLGVDLMLSGHTHRGQIFPGNLITSRIYQNHWGHLQIGDFHSIVTSGYGFWGPPIRLGTRSEIVQVTVSFAGNSTETQTQ